MNRQQQPAVIAFALGLIGLGVLALIYGDFALVWQPVPASLVGRSALAYASGLLMLFGGIGLCFRASAVWSARVLFPYLLLWALLKVPALVAAPKVEANWLGVGEIAVLFAGGWMLFAALGEIKPGSLLGFASGERGIRLAAILFGVALIPIGLSHFFYVKDTAGFIPAWIPFRTGFAYLTGIGHIGCGVGVLLSVSSRVASFPRVAALIEAGMVSLFALLVWAPAILASPKARLPWTAFFITWFFAASAWVVSSYLPTRRDRG